ncbi:hypothetical protein CVT26_010291 [Gymnopilus dilepis]|uniref:FAD-binding domain-containing protein n=1 Tax=Gymnopilus dilepis TaxID=231916 RepID=A0A409Y0W9_9AGAR|nr:hypothetical protein CVT26_010291 [Gymnopilus dilepis]
MTNGLDSISWAKELNKTTVHRITMSTVGFDLSAHISAIHGVKRADLIEMLHELASPFCSFVVGKVVSITSSPTPEATLDSGETLRADLLLGADGIRSIVRQYILQAEDKPVPTGDCAFRAVIPTESFKEDLELQSLLDIPQATCWMGPGKHIVGYCVREKREYNLVMIHPDTESDESWTASATGDEGHEVVRPCTGGDENEASSQVAVGSMARPERKDFITRGLLPPDAGMVNKVHEVRGGDGGYQKIEDAAVLGSLFARISGVSQIEILLKGYQDLRQRRTAATQRASQANQHRFHIPDGPEQEVRDEAMKKAMEDTLSEREEHGNRTDRIGNKSIVTDHNKQLASTQFDYDAERAVENWWNDNRTAVELAGRW